MHDGETPGYHGTHQDINMLMLFPWPENLRLTVHGGQLGRHNNITWRQYLALVGEYWEQTYRYSRCNVEIDTTRITVREQTYWGQLWGLAVRAMLERGYLDFQGGLHPPVPFEEPPPEYRERPDGG